ncbi:hypothetical protein [Nitrosomonas communis]|uniref:hypothetical protein n=1 Tax=Nitrosomonas communis TaxID=44574 RepID=UPI003D2E6054
MSPLTSGGGNSSNFQNKTGTATDATVADSSEALAISDAPAPPSVPNKLLSPSTEETIISLQQFILFISRKLRRILARNGKVYVVVDDAGNVYVVLLRDRKVEKLIREWAHRNGLKIRKYEFNEIIEYLQAEAEMNGVKHDVYYRVAPIPGGIEIDLGDESHARVRITAGKVEIVTQNSTTLFCRNQAMQAMVRPAAKGDRALLRKYLNLHPVDIMLFIAWLSYTLAHPKVLTSNYVILVLLGNQGSGKSWLCRLIRLLLDPSQIQVQLLPSKVSDLAIAAQNAHCLIFDNVRSFSQAMADNLCVAATGGTISGRQLYTDEGQHVLHLHVALVLNGIHSFIEQPDLAQRCLPLDLLPLDESKRKSEVELNQELQADLPAIMRGLFDLIADIFKHLPTAEVTNPERMIDFVRWLAAFEQADGTPAGYYQAVYSDVLCQGQLHSLLENPLAAAVFEFAEDLAASWSGTPAELLQQLNSRVTPGTQRSKEWPPNAIALSKRLIPLQPALQAQDIRVELGRAKHRIITITKLGDQND